ncbi:MAG: hypothetical protein ACE5KH_05070 [Candidatus Geothermarchaeales archaeon]
MDLEFCFLDITESDVDPSGLWIWGLSDQGERSLVAVAEYRYTIYGAQVSSTDSDELRQHLASRAPYSARCGGRRNLSGSPISAWVARQPDGEGWRVRRGKIVGYVIVKEDGPRHERSWHPIAVERFEVYLEYFVSNQVIRVCLRVLSPVGLSRGDSECSMRARKSVLNAS